MRTMHKVALAVLALGLLSCDGDVSGPSAVPAPSPSPTPVPLEEACKVKRVNLSLTADGRSARVWGLGQIATFKANVLFAGELMPLDSVDAPAFDPNTCPESAGWHWDKTGEAADGCLRQGQRDWVTYTLACDIPGVISVCASPYGYDNVVGCFDSEVRGL